MTPPTKTRGRSRKSNKDVKAVFKSEEITNGNYDLELNDVDCQVVKPQVEHESIDDGIEVENNVESNVESNADSNVESNDYVSNKSSSDSQDKVKSKNSNIHSSQESDQIFNENCVELEDKCSDGKNKAPGIPTEDGDVNDIKMMVKDEESGCNRGDMQESEQTLINSKDEVKDDVDDPRSIIGYDRKKTIKWLFTKKHSYVINEKTMNDRKTDNNSTENSYSDKVSSKKDKKTNDKKNSHCDDKIEVIPEIEEIDTTDIKNSLSEGVEECVHEKLKKNSSTEKFKKFIVGRMRSLGNTTSSKDFKDNDTANSDKFSKKIEMSLEHEERVKDKDKQNNQYKKTEDEDKGKKIVKKISSTSHRGNFRKSWSFKATKSKKKLEVHSVDDSTLNKKQVGETKTVDIQDLKESRNSHHFKKKFKFLQKKNKKDINSNDNKDANCKSNLVEKENSGNENKEKEIEIKENKDENKNHKWMNHISIFKRKSSNPINTNKDVDDNKDLVDSDNKNNKVKQSESDVKEDGDDKFSEFVNALIVETNKKNKKSASRNTRESNLVNPINKNIALVSISLSSGYYCYSYGFMDKGIKKNIQMMKQRDEAESGIYEQRGISCILFDKQHAFHSIGQKARTFYHDLNDDESLDWLYIDKLNFTFDELSDINKEDLRVSAENNEKILVSDIIKYYLKDLKSAATSEIKNLESVVYDSIEFVLGVSHRWNSIVKEIVYKEADKLNIKVIDELNTVIPYIRNIDVDVVNKECEVLSRKESTRSILSSDSVGGSLSINVQESFCDNFRNSRLLFDDGNPIVVLDCGISGATSGLYERKDNDYQLTYNTSTTLCKSSEVDARFVGFLNNIFGVKFMKQYYENHKKDYVTIMNGFYCRKNSTKLKRSDKAYDLVLLYSFIDFYEKICKQPVGTAIKNANIDGVVYSSTGILKIPNKVMVSFFKSQLDSLVIFLNDELKNVRYRDVRNVILVGGFSNSQLLVKNITESLKDKYLVKLMPGSSTAYVKGGVYQQYDDIVSLININNYEYSVKVIEYSESSGSGDKEKETKNKRNSRIPKFEYSKIPFYKTITLKRDHHFKNMNRKTSIEIYRCKLSDKEEKIYENVVSIEIPGVKENNGECHIDKLSKKIQLGITNCNQNEMIVDVQCGVFNRLLKVDLTQLSF